MALTLILWTWILYLKSVSGWTYTEYITIDTSLGLNSETYISTVTVSPTGSVSPTSTKVTTFEELVYFKGNSVSFNVTVTDLYLAPKGSVCTPRDEQFSCTATASALKPTDTIETSVWAAVTITNLARCTQTSFTYTTSSFGLLDDIGQVEFPGLFSQAAQTGPGGEALFVTTYVSTISVDLGGQAITATRCDVWLKDAALFGITPSYDELTLQAECVDPRRFLCKKTAVDTLGDCGTDWIGTYPMTPGASNGGVSTQTTTGGAGPPPSSTAKAGGVGGLSSLLRAGMMLTALTATVSAYLFLY